MHEPQQLLAKNQVRRLTPLECTRLQGFPDGWVDIGDWEDTKGRLHKEADAPKYKALGNSIAIPFWEWMARRMVEVLKRDGVEHPTMCSLFDGIGGFPLSFQRAGCEPVWASEIEEFPIAVTKRHFPERSQSVSRLPSVGSSSRLKLKKASPSAEAAVWSTVRRMEATRAVVRGVSDTLMADMADLVEQGVGASEPAPKPRRGRPRKTDPGEGV